MAEDIALSIKDLHKDFLLPHERKNSIKELILHFNKPTFERMHALQDVNFEVKRGEFFGIVGRNGSGKSTLLKLMGGIYQPTSGSIKVNGTLTPFIELGIGFNPELTGRENVFLNGAILGLTRKEVQARYDEIVEFAELGKFMDQKLKNYSSGMQVRLAFSIAIQAHNDILLIDEVLAVGDSAFQRKCYDTFQQIKKSGRTVIFVTHDMGAVQTFCDRALMIENSKVLMVGKPREVALRYEVANASSEEAAGKSSAKKRPKSDEVELLDVTVRSDKKDTHLFALDEDIIADVRFKVHNLKEALQFNLFLTKPDGTYMTGINTGVKFGEYLPSKRTHTITCRIKAGQLIKGEYFVNVGAYTYVEPARLIDVLDESYGVKVPKISILEHSLYQDGQFYLDGQWSKKDKAK